MIISIVITVIVIILYEDSRNDINGWDQEGIVTDFLSLSSCGGI